MEQTRRKREDSIIVNTKRRKISTTDNSNSLFKNSVISLEDLSNELLYSIFDFLDFSDVYNAFSNLNTRLDNVLNGSNFSIKTDLSFSSGSTFHCFWTNVLLCNQHRIQSLQLANSCVIALAYLSTSIWSKFTRLQNVIFHHIDSKYFSRVTNSLIVLPCLSSLVINYEDNCKNIDNIYQNIFRLSKLKYCKISCKSHPSYKSLPMATTTFSPIESLIITCQLRLDDLNTILSYVPQLRRLSISCHDNADDTPIHSYSTMLNNLTHVSLNLSSVKPQQLERMSAALFQHVQVLRISTNGHLLSWTANFWEQLILSYMPHLRVFNGNFRQSMFIWPQFDQFKSWMDGFRSSFWTKRHWFFEYDIYDDNNQWCFVFYSTNLYK